MDNKIALKQKLLEERFKSSDGFKKFPRGFFQYEGINGYNLIYNGEVVLRDKFIIQKNNLSPFYFSYQDECDSKWKLYIKKWWENE